jgi:putative Mn2+ efflux pump MntP
MELILLFVPVVLMGLSLAMDAVAASISVGICLAEVKQRYALRTALVFGSFQALMPAVGWFLGRSFRDLIRPVDHWIAFALLVFIGLKMIVETVKEEPGDRESCPVGDPVAWPRLLVIGIATSIDALAAGISLSIEDIPIVPSAAIIGIVTFILAYLAVLLGKRLGKNFRRRACITGGLILIALGVKIVVEHLILGI